MNERYLEITYRHGRPLAAYLYLPRLSEGRSHRSAPAASGVVVDFGPDDRPIGIEITAPGRVSLEGLNDVLRDLGQPPLEPADLAPLLAA